MAACYGLRDQWNSPSRRLINAFMNKQNCVFSEKKLCTFKKNWSRGLVRFREIEKCDEFNCRFAFLASWLRSTWRVTELQRWSISVLGRVVDCFGLNFPEETLRITSISAGPESKRHVWWVKMCFNLDLHTMTCCTVNPRKLEFYFSRSYVCCGLPFPMFCSNSISWFVLTYNSKDDFSLHVLYLHLPVWGTPFCDEVQRL